MATKQVINQPQLDIEGDFTPRAKTVGELIAAGKLEEAESALQNVGDTTREDLSASALLADIRAGEAETLAGRAPSNQLTRSGAFKGGATPFQLQEALKSRAEKAQGLEREDKRLKIMTNQYRVNTEIKLERMKNDLLTMVNRNKSKDTETQVGDIKFIVNLWQKRINSGLSTKDEKARIEAMTELALKKIQQLRAE